MFLEGHLKKMIPIAFERFGILPSVIYEETPHDLALVMFKKNEPTVTPVAPEIALKKINDDRAKKGLKPVVPKFGSVFDGLFPGVR